jgi:hypothetical protein
MVTNFGIVLSPVIPFVVVLQGEADTAAGVVCRRRCRR